MVASENSEAIDKSDLPDELRAALRRYLNNNGDCNGVDRGRYEAVSGAVQELLAEQDGGHNEIDTQSGETIRPLDPAPEKIELEDIAHGLANVGRFAGQGKEFHSVARHSVHVSREAMERGASRETQRYALVHDAAEAYLSDVPGPVKKSLPGYKHAERRIDEAVVDALGLASGEIERELVGDADRVVGEYELSVMFPEAEHEEPPDLQSNPDAGASGENDKTRFLNLADDLGLR